jgi:hypothetical protein
MTTKKHNLQHSAWLKPCEQDQFDKGGRGYTYTKMISMRMPYSNDFQGTQVLPVQFTHTPGWWLVHKKDEYDRLPEYPIGPFGNLRAAIRCAIVMEKMQ